METVSISEVCVTANALARQSRREGAPGLYPHAPLATLLAWLAWNDGAVSVPREGGTNVFGQEVEADAGDVEWTVLEAWECIASMVDLTLAA